jgi:hypothetical protein
MSGAEAANTAQLHFGKDFGVQSLREVSNTPTAESILTEKQVEVYFRELTPLLWRISFEQNVIVPYNYGGFGKSLLRKPAFAIRKSTGENMDRWTLVAPTAITRPKHPKPWTVGYIDKQGRKDAKNKEFVFPIIATDKNVHTEKVTKPEDLDYVKKTFYKACVGKTINQLAPLLPEVFRPTKS